MGMGRTGLRFSALLASVCLLAGCIIPGVNPGGTAAADRDLLPVPRRVNYNILSDPFYPRTDILVYKCKKDGTMVPVPVDSLDSVGIIASPSDDPDRADAVDE